MRRLTFEQLPEIEAIARQCFEETKQPDESFDFEHFKFAIEGAIRNETAIIWVEGDPIHAFLLGNFVPGLFGGAPSAYAVSRFVKPEFRSRGIGSKFIAEFRAEGGWRGCKHFYAGSPFTVNADADKAFFEKRGWRHVENLYRLDVS